MEEKYEEYKKSNTYKQKKKRSILLVLIFLIIIILFVIFYFINKEKEPTLDENKIYTYEVIDNIVYLKSEEEIIGTYKCISNCEIYKDIKDIEFTQDGKALIKEENNIFLYNLISKKKQSDNFKEVNYILNDNKIELFIIRDSFGKEGIVDLNGNIKVNYIYNELGKITNNDFINYSFANNYITAKSGDKWGLISLNNGKGLIDFQYEDFIVTPYNKFVVKESGLWELVDNSNKKLLTKGYDSIKPFKDNIVVSEKDNAFVLDELGNIISNKIKLTEKYNPWNDIKGIDSYEKDGDLYLEIDVKLKDNDYLKETYIFNKEQHELIKTNN